MLFKLILIISVLSANGNSNYDESLNNDESLTDAELEDFLRSSTKFLDERSDNVTVQALKSETNIQAPLSKSIIQAPESETIIQAPLSETTIQAPESETTTKAPLFETIIQALDSALHETSVQTPKSEGSIQAQQSEVKPRKQCHRGTAEKVAGELKSAVYKGVDGIESVVNSMTNGGKGLIGGAVNAIGKGGRDLVEHTADAVDMGFVDAVCDVRDVVGDVTSGFVHGNILKGAVYAGKDIVIGIADIGADIADTVAKGISALADDALEFLSVF